MQRKWLAIFHILYVLGTLGLLFLEVVFQFGHSLLVLGQAFLVEGFILLWSHTVGYLFSFLGFFMVLYSVNLFSIDMFFFRYALVAFFPFVPLFLLFSEWNDKQRMVRKGGLQVEGTYVGLDPYGCPRFRYFIHEKKYVGVSYKRGEYIHYELQEKVPIWVSAQDYKKIFVPSPRKHILFLKKVALFLGLFAFLAIFIMFFGS